MTSYRIRHIKTDGTYDNWKYIKRTALQDTIARCEHDLAELHILGIQLQRYTIHGRIVQDENPITLIIPESRLQFILDGSLKSWLPRVKKAYKALVTSN